MRRRKRWGTVLFAPREWLGDLEIGEGRLPSPIGAMLWLSAAGAGAGARADGWVPWHMAAWAAGWAVGLMVGLALLHATVLRPLGGKARYAELLGVWGAVSVPAGALMPLNWWAVLHPPQDAFALSGSLLLTDLLTKLALGYGLALGVLATAAVNRFEFGEEVGERPWWEPRDILLALTAPRRLFDALQSERGPMLASRHLGSALLVIAAVGVGDAYVRSGGLWSPLPSFYLLTPPADLPAPPIPSGGALAGAQIGAVGLTALATSLLLWWAGRASRGSATLGQLFAATGLSLTPLLLFDGLSIWGKEMGRAHLYLGFGAAAWAAGLSSLAVSRLNPGWRLNRRGPVAALAVVALAAFAWAGRSAPYQHGLIVDNLRWQVWASPRGEANAHLRLALALSKAAVDSQGNSDLTPAIPGLMSLTEDYPNSEFTARAWDQMYSYYFVRRDYDKAQDCMDAILRMPEGGRFDAESWHGRALLTLGRLCWAKGQLEEAESYFRRLAAEYPEHRREAADALQMVADDRRQ